MISLVVGDNCTGKTIALRKLRQECSGTAIANFEDKNILEIAKLDETSLNLLSGLTACTISTNATYTELTGFAALCACSTVPKSAMCLQILSVVCKDVDAFFLDEPDIGLSKVELSTLIELIQHLSDEYNKTFWITTHREDWLVLRNINIYTVDCGKLVERSKYEVHEMLLPL